MELTLNRERQNREMDDYVKSFKRYLSDYRSNLNTQGIWLFLATLGCWSVPDSTLQNVAMFVTFVIFANEVLIEWEQEGKHLTFKAATKLVEDKICLLSEKEDREFWMLVLSNVKTQQISILKAITGTYVYILSFLFYIVCYWYMFL